MGIYITDILTSMACIPIFPNMQCDCGDGATNSIQRSGTFSEVE